MSYYNRGESFLADSDEIRNITGRDVILFKLFKDGNDQVTLMGWSRDGLELIPFVVRQKEGRVIFRQADQRIKGGVQGVFMREDKLELVYFDEEVGGGNPRLYFVSMDLT